MSMNTADQITAILQAEFKLTSQLSEILQQEREALKSSDHQLITELTKQKQPMVLQLEQLGRQREAVLSSVGFPAGKSGLEAFIANQTAADASRLNQVVEKLRVVARECRSRNSINGGVINVNRQHLIQALSILRGRDPQTSAYGPGGEYTSQVVRQPLLGRV